MAFKDYVTQIWNVIVFYSGVERVGRSKPLYWDRHPIAKSQKSRTDGSLPSEMSLANVAARYP